MGSWLYCAPRELGGVGYILWCGPRPLPSNFFYPFHTPFLTFNLKYNLTPQSFPPQIFFTFSTHFTPIILYSILPAKFNLLSTTTILPRLHSIPHLIPFAHKFTPPYLYDFDFSPENFFFAISRAFLIHSLICQLLPVSFCPRQFFTRPLPGCLCGPRLSPL